MEGIVENRNDDARGRRLLLAVIASSLLLLPWVAMQLTEEVVWGAGDFVVFGVMLAAVAVAFEIAASRRRDGRGRAAFGVAILTAFLLVWVNLGVGIVGAEGDPANLIYAGVLAVGVLGALRAGFRPDGMATAMVVTAMAQGLAGLVAVAAGWGSSANAWPRDVVGATVVFAAAWLFAAWLFRSAARDGSRTGG